MCAYFPIIEQQKNGEKKDHLLDAIRQWNIHDVVCLKSGKNVSQNCYLITMMNWFHNHHQVKRIEFRLNEVDQVLTILRYSMIPWKISVHYFQWFAAVDLSIGVMVEYINILNKSRNFHPKRKEMLT